MIALVASVISIAGLRRTASSLDRILDDNLPSVIAAGELENALLEQRGYITTFMVSGGDERWLTELGQRQELFRHWLNRAKDVAYTNEEQVLLAELSEIISDYDVKRRMAIDLIRSGKTEDAKTIMFGEANELYRQAYSRCESLNETNQSLMRDVSRNAARTVDWISVGVIGAITVQAALGGVLLVVFYRGVLKPVRQMTSDLQQYALDRPRERLEHSDEVGIVANYLRLLLTDVAQFQDTLESQRRALFNAQKMASVGRIAASLAHEIRNPLTAMKMWLFSARGALADGSEVAGTLDSVTQEVRRLEAIVRHFLEFSRPPDTRLAWVPVTELVANSIALVEPLIREKGIVFREDISPDLSELRVDRQQMMQVLVNLLRNSAESLPKEGSIVISAIRQFDKNGMHEAVLIVRDNGPGIPPEQQASVFEPFFTTKEEGTGLGLAIVQSIVSRHGGRVEIESSAEDGTEISIHLPTQINGKPE